jgi:hypothetical protein
LYYYGHKICHKQTANQIVLFAFSSFPTFGTFKSKMIAIILLFVVHYLHPREAYGRFHAGGERQVRIVAPADARLSSLRHRKFWLSHCFTYRPTATSAIRRQMSPFVIVRRARHRTPGAGE